MSIKLNLAQRGFTLIEMLVGLALGLFIAANGIFIYSSVLKSYYDLLAVNRLDQQLRTAMNSMIVDIRRAGYSANAISNLKAGANTNLFMASATNLSTPTSNCILFSYDSNSSGTLPALNAATLDKRFGYRLSGTTLQSRAPTDSAFSCTSGTWNDLTDRNLIRITNLSFTVTPTVITLNGTNTLTIRNIAISMTGNLTQDTPITRTISGTVKVRNDRYQP